MLVYLDFFLYLCTQNVCKMEITSLIRQYFRTNEGVTNPLSVVANRTDIVAEYNETFLQDKELEQLW